MEPRKRKSFDSESTESKLEAKTEREIQLEEIENPDVLKWAKALSTKTQSLLASSDEAKESKDQILSIYEDTRKIPSVTMGDDGYFYNLWQDKSYKQGLWRRTTLEEYKKPEPKWENLLNLDELLEEKEWAALTDAKPDAADKIKWVFAEAERSPDQKSALVSLSPAGSDASVCREFDLTTKKFVKGGFQFKLSKSTVSWYDPDSVLVGIINNEEDATASGYPRTAKLLQRGESLDQAKLIFQGEKSDVVVTSGVTFRAEKSYAYILRSIDFFKNEIFIINADLSLTQIPVPHLVLLRAIIDNEAIFRLAADWHVPNGPMYTMGSVISISLNSIKDPEHLQTSLVFKPTKTCFLEAVSVTKNHILLTLKNNIVSEIHQYVKKNGQWLGRSINIPPNSTAVIHSDSHMFDDFLIEYNGYLHPDTLCYFDSSKNTLETLKSSPCHFDAKKFATAQYFATSKDGTQIPYSVIHSKEMKLDGTSPTLLYAYGGFEVSILPEYSGVRGKFWLEKGGVWVDANIRGGDEFGPAWHQAGLKEKRQTVYDDFFAVAEDLIKRKITTPKKLGCWGGSNGGLLMGVAYTQRPELFNAVVCDNPLLDMLNYHTMLAGNSWMAEYGDPEDPKIRAFLRGYSPYHNVKPDKNYPQIFITTNIKDDRVHPSHARKMVDKLLTMGHPVTYFEGNSGGHSGGENLEHHAEITSMRYDFLRKQLMQNKLECVEADKPKMSSTTALLITQVGTSKIDPGKTKESIEATKDVTTAATPDQHLYQLEELETTTSMRPGH